MDAQSDIAPEQTGCQGSFAGIWAVNLCIRYSCYRGPQSKALKDWPSFWQAIGDIIRLRRGRPSLQLAEGRPKVF